MMSVGDADMRAAMGSLYDSSVPLPRASYILLGDHETRRELEAARAEMASRAFSESGPQREQSWSDSWAAVRDRFRESNYSLDVLDPPYVSANPVVRWMGRYALAQSPNFEMEVYRYVRETVFRRLMDGAVAVHDVGAGSCFNAAAYCEFNPSARVFTYDWAPASADIAEDLREHHNMRVYGHRFDFFKPDLVVDGADVVMTTCAMEQLGGEWRPFLDNLLTARPRRVVHVEPILEKYGETEFDAVARDYHESRRYLRGYYSELMRLRDRGEIRVVCDLRTGIGSRFHECYTVVAWEPR